jgi:hypothetical protein
MSPGVNGSSLTPREMAGKAAASVLNVAARRLVKAQPPGAGAQELAATGCSVLGGQLLRWGRWWNLRDKPGSQAGRARPGHETRRRIGRKGLCGRAACGWTATSSTGPG